MLVLTRKEDEKVVITVPPSSTETKIEVCLNQLSPSRARLGFVAPKEVKVLRKEIAE